LEIRLKAQKRISMRFIYFFILISFFSSGLPANIQDEEKKKGVKRDFVDFLLDYAEIKYSGEYFDRFIYVSVKSQRLYLIEDRVVLKEYTISSAKNGIGFDFGSEKTPTGLHYIKQKIGNNVPLGGVFKSRMFTGSTAEILEDPIHSSDDNITTRIMWLSGKEKGLNLGGDRDSYNRMIYIHGTDEEGLIGTPVSHGCIRMKNKDVLELYNLVQENTLVLILNN
jgi:hypothetical protein